MRSPAWRSVAALSRAASTGRLARPQSLLLPSSHPVPLLSSFETKSARLAGWRTFSSTRRRFQEGQQQDDGLPKLTKFAELGDQGLVHPNIVNNITKTMGLDNMTEVQSASIRAALLGTDVIAQAKTGTGKTLAFLIPLLERMIQADPDLARATYRPPRTSADDIRGIVISPTRELAEQIAVEARKVTQGTAIQVQAAVGGTMKRQMLQQMQRQGCHLLVGTPGRLADIFEDEYSGVSAPRLKALVLDEADRLLDQGFWPDIKNFMTLIPPREQVDRQTLMFSATIPREVVHIVRQTLKPGFQFTRIIGDNDTPTTERVKQFIAILQSRENELPALYELVDRVIKANKASPETTRPFKAIVYFRSTIEVTFAYEVFRNLSLSGTARRDAFGARAAPSDHPFAPCRMYSIHSRLTQAQRTAAAEDFRAAKSAILFSSDVTARGMDFPNVTHVIQVGNPQDRESYIHRIGRTARAGREGEGWLIVPGEDVNSADRMLSNIPLSEDTSLKLAQVPLSPDDASGPDSPISVIRNAAQAVSAGDKAAVYQHLLCLPTRNKRARIASVNNMATVLWGMREPPAIAKGAAERHGFAGMEGLRIGDRRAGHDSDNPFQQSGGFGGSGGSRFGGRGSGGNQAGRFGGGGGGRSFTNDRNDRRSGFGGDRGGQRGRYAYN